MNIFILKNNREEYLFEIDEWRDPHFHRNIKNAKIYTDEQEVKTIKNIIAATKILKFSNLLLFPKN